MTEDLNTLREALEPCPFCGGDAVVDGEWTCGHFVSCMGCYTVIGESWDSAGMPAHQFKTKAEAIAAWNRRAPRLEAAAAAEYERGRQDGMKQEHALWQMQRIGQEIEAAAVPELSREDVVRLAREAGLGEYLWFDDQDTPMLQRFASLVRSVPAGREVRGWMCATNWHHELGEASDGTEIYGDLDDLKKHRPCWKQCGVVEVIVRLADENQSGGDRAQYHADLIASVKEMRAARPAVPVGEVKPGAWPDSVSDTVLQTPEPDRWVNDEPRPVPMFHMATLMRYGERCAEAGMAAITQAVKTTAGEVGPVSWEGGEEWEALAWHLCAEEHGEDACNELIWEGGPVPEPWGDRWMKYEPEAKRMISLVRQFTTPPAPIEGWRWVPVEPTDDMLASFADATSGTMVWDNATEEDRQSVRDGFTPGYRAMLSAAPQPGDKALEEPAQVAPEHQAQVDQMAADAEARREKERGILLEAANHLEGDGHFMPAEDADWAAGWIRRQIGAGATP